MCCSRVWETFRFRFFALAVEFGTKAVACYVKGYHHPRLLQGAWSYKISPLWGCPHWSGLLLQWAKLSTQSLSRLVFCHNAISVNFKHDIRGSKFTLIMETLEPVQSWLCLLEVRVSFPCPHTYTPRSNSAIIALLNITVRFTLEHFPSHLAPCSRFLCRSHSPSSQTSVEQSWACHSQKLTNHSVAFGG